MIGRLAVLFAALVVAGVLLNLYYFAVFFVFGFALRIDAPMFQSVAYWLCLVAAIVTTFFVMRPAWRIAGPKKKTSPEKSDEV